LKVEINTSEIEAHDPSKAVSFRVDNPWFAGEAEVSTYSREEMLATKLRALLQRNKGRDLFDLAHALEVFPGLSRRFGPKARKPRVTGACESRGLEDRRKSVTPSSSTHPSWARGPDCVSRVYALCGLSRNGVRRTCDRNDR
jgi:hypothetical protein